MAVRARLAAPPPIEPEPLPALAPSWAELPAHLLAQGDRRLEAETYLSSGYGLRLAIEERGAGWVRLGQLANVWQPSRLKGILVGPEFGTPFLAATQVFDLRPIPRKWLALSRTENSAGRFVTPGTILVTCSGAVGRATLAHHPHAGVLISHDLLRVEPRAVDQWGWLYAYLRSAQARLMMGGAQYGHIIKHLETSHLEALPVPVVRPELAVGFKKRTQDILDLRNAAYLLEREADERFERALGPLDELTDQGESGFEVRVAALSAGRRRLEAMANNPGVAAVRTQLARRGKGFVSLREAGYDVWLPGRFKRIPAEGGVELIDSSAVFEINPDYDKRIADSDFGDPHKGRVRAGWLLMARSGQTYGLNGSVAFATVAHEGRVVSDDLLRIAPNSAAKVPAGYLFVALSHPRLGRPLIKAMAYGSSIPHIDAADLLAFEVVRLAAGEEDEIAKLSQNAAAARARADLWERELASDAGRLVERFIAGDKEPFATFHQQP